jgi:hypothetical protein
MALAGDDLLLLVGPGEALPWADGALYLGRDPAAPALLLPTMLAPSVPLELLERALRRRLAASGPLALLPRAGAVEVVALAGARTVTAERLAQWAA